MTPWAKLATRNVIFSIMCRFCRSVRKNSWFLHHKNVPSHMALILLEFLAKNAIHIVPPPPYSYSPDLVPCNICLVPILERRLHTNMNLLKWFKVNLCAIWRLYWEMTLEMEKTLYKCLNRLLSQKADPIKLKIIRLPTQNFDRGYDDKDYSLWP